MHGRRVNKPPSTVLLNSTDFQIIASGVVSIVMCELDKNVRAGLKPNVVDDIGTMTHHCDKYWDGRALK